jgi:CDP-paratose 2-epimerase
MRILVTGGEGFIGSHICEYYAKERNEVIALDNSARLQILKASTEVQKIADYNQRYLKGFPGIKFVNIDVRDLDGILHLMHDVDLVFHTAGQVAVTTSVTDPLTDFQINACGTFNVCEAVRRSNSDPLIIFCSTNKVYGDLEIPVKELEERYVYTEVGGINEMYPLEANCPYGASKISAEMVLQSYFQTYGLRTIRARLSCIYGTRQLGCEDQAWIAHFVISTLTRKPITVYGDGKQIRDILYVSDLVSAFSSLAENAERTVGQAYNIGGSSENSISLLETINLLDELTGLRSAIEYKDWRLGDQKVYISDISKIHETTSWKPMVTAREGIGKLVNWYRSILLSR